MGWVREKSSTALHRSQNARFAFDAQVNVQVGLVGHITNQGFRLMGVEIVHDEMPLHDLWISFDGVLDMREKIGLIPWGTSRNLSDRASRDMEVDDQGQRAMPDVLELPAQDR